MAENKPSGTLTRGPDGALYLVSPGACQRLAGDSEKPVAVSGRPDIRSVSSPGDDHASARVMIDPGDHASARVMIEAGDHASARVMIDPGDHASARVMIDPGDHASARVMIEAEA